MNQLLDDLIPFIPIFVLVIGVGIFLWSANWLMLRRSKELSGEKRFTRQMLMLGLTVFALIVVIVFLPINDDSRNKLLGLAGILISGIIAFSSTTIFTNLASGILLRITRPFRTGDFIRVGDHFGRVSERGLFDTEIQAETRELVALPNAFLITNPVTTIRSSGTIISASLSLGYDLNHNHIESLLVEAAKKSELEEPYVHILMLGDFSVSYRVSGFLSETKLLISARSRLNGCILDVLHENNIEIVSPNFMNQRPLADGYRAIPVKSSQPHVQAQAGSIEDIAFDKADRAEGLEKERFLLVEESEKLNEALKLVEDPAERDKIKEKLERIKERLTEIEKLADAIPADEKGSEGSETKG